MGEVEAQVRIFIAENFLLGGEEAEADDSLLDRGVIDSTGVLELVTFIENAFEIQVEDDELVPENLDSINNILAFISRKRGQVA